MNIAISNIAWDPKEDKEILSLLKKYNLHGIELAPTMIWKEPTKESAKSIKKYKKFWNDEGISIVSIQALLYGHPELTIFNTLESRSKTLKYIEKMIQVCSYLEIEDIIFGSPINRDRGVLTLNKSLDIAADFFYAVGEVAKKNDIYFCIEPIPKEYGTNFINSTTQGITLVKKVNHPYFKLHLDSGALTVTKEDYKTSIIKALPYLKHFHISEKNLAPIGGSGTDHKTIANVLNDSQFTHWLSIEMRRNEQKPNYKMVEEVLKYVTEVYS